MFTSKLWGLLISMSLLVGCYSYSTPLTTDGWYDNFYFYKTTEEKCLAIPETKWVYGYCRSKSVLPDLELYKYWYDCVRPEKCGEVNYGNF